MTTPFADFPPRLVPGIRSRAITAENPDGAKGSGGREASRLGVGRKGRPCLTLQPGRTTTLADIEGAGRITHIWTTFPDHTSVVGYVLRDLVLRMYWDGETTPSVEVPIGDFFCCGAGARTDVNSMPIVVASNGGMNSYFPMPFGSHARITVTNEHPVEVPGFFFQIDFETYDENSSAFSTFAAEDDGARFHAQWRRERTTTLGRDFTVLDNVQGHGAYVGTHIGVSALERFWWGEGEMKFFVDGDTDFPTICGTGLEDYALGAWGFMAAPEKHAPAVPKTFSAPYSGYPQYITTDPSRMTGTPEPMAPYHGMYRWHIPDPIRFESDLRVTLQQIGNVGPDLFERSDDVSSVAYWYQREPHGAFPEFPSRADRNPR